jgi:superfamily II DNA or RNA helicase
MKIFIGNCHSTLDGYTPEIEIALSVASPNYWFSPRYKQGLWDGRTHFLRIPSLRFPTGLLHVVTETCQKNNIEYQIIDQRDIPLFNIDEWLVMPDLASHILNDITLRDYQIEALASAMVCERGCLEMATGSGKTEVAASIIKLLNKRTLFLVHTRDLLRQTAERFEVRLGVKVGRYGDTHKEYEQDIIVATVQSISALLKTQERVAKTWLKEFEVLFMDECHHASANTWYKIGLLAHNAYWRYGLSGTVLRRDELSNFKMLALFGPPIYQLQASDLIEQGHLSPIKVEMLKNDEVVVGQTWQKVYEEGVVRSVPRNSLVVDRAANAFIKGRSVMILVRQIEHGHILQRMLVNQRHLPAIFLSGQSHSEDRGRAIYDYNSGMRFIIIASTIFDEGVDLPAVNTLILAGGGKSEVKTIQRVGRGLRKKQDNSTLLVYDFMDASKFLRKHSLHRRVTYVNQKFL